MKNEKLNIVICGGGRTGHLSAVLFKQRPNVKVSLLTENLLLVKHFQKNGGEIKAIRPEGSILTARPDVVSCQVEETLKDADMVIITVPAHIRPDLLKKIAPHLPSHKTVFVGAIPGFCGFDWLAEKVLNQRPNVVIWGMKDVPHIAFDLCLGEWIRMGGAKNHLYIACHQRESLEAHATLLAYLQSLYGMPIEILPNYLAITLTPGNPIMHSSVIYGHIGPYGQRHKTHFSSLLCWWEDCPELAAYFLQRSDEENQLLCRAIEKILRIDLSSVHPLLEEIREAYAEQIIENHTLLSVLRTNQAYRRIPLPLIPVDQKGYVFDKTHRAFHEDVNYGLSLLVAMAKRLNLDLPYIEKIYSWIRDDMGSFSSCQSALDYFPEHWPNG